MDLAINFRRQAQAAFRTAALLLLLFAAGALRPAHAQAGAAWSAIGPAGGTVSTLPASPASAATLYAGTPENGVFVSTDGGQTWSAQNAGLATAVIGRQSLVAVYALATDGAHLYAATAAGLYYAAAVAVPQWTALAATGSAHPITLLAYDASTQRLFAASTTADANAPAVYVAAVDPAAAPAPSWQPSALPAAAGTPIGAMALVPATGSSAAALIVGAGNGVYTASLPSAGAQPAWANGDPSATLAGDTVNALHYSADFAQAYACSGGNVFYSGNPLDAVPVWLQAGVASSGSAPIVCNGFATLPLASGGLPQLLLGTDQGAFISLDGTSFAATGALQLHSAANAFAVLPASGAPAKVFTAAGFGIGSGDVGAASAGSAWTASNQRLNNASIADAVWVGSTLFAAANDLAYAEVFASTDGGATWTPTGIASVLSAGQEILSLASDSANGQLYAATSQGLMAYSAASQAWSAVGAATISGRVSALATSTHALLIGTDNGLFDIPLGAAPAGATPSSAGLSGNGVKALHVAGGTVYAAVLDVNGDSYVYSAAESAVEASAPPVWAFFGSGSTGTTRVTALLYAGGKLLAATNGNLLLYATASAPWASANTSVSAAQQIADPFGVVTALYSDGNTVYAATGSNGVYASALGSGYAWTQVNGSGDSALPSTEVHSLRASGSLLYAATRAGLASVDTSALGGAGGGTGGGGGSGGGQGSLPDNFVAPPSGSGGGAFGPLPALGLLAAVVALASARRRSRDR